MQSKVRRLLESSTGNSSSASIGILSRSYQVKIPHYGGTASRETELKVASSLSLSRYDSCREGPLPFWGGRNYRRDDDGDDDDRRGNGCYEHRPHVEMESGSVGYSRSVPMYCEGVGRGECEGVREGEPEGREDRNYSRQGGVGEEGEGKTKRRSDSLTDEQQQLREGGRERGHVGRKRGRRRSEGVPGEDGDGVRGERQDIERVD